MRVAFLDRQVAVCGQVLPRDFPALAAEGFRTYVNNRPDGEAWFGQPTHAALEAAAREAGMAAYHVPLTPQTLRPDDVRRFHEAISRTPDRVLAACASGFRSTLIWAIAKVAYGEMDIETVLEAAAAAGRPLAAQRAFVEHMAAQVRG